MKSKQSALPITKRTVQSVLPAEPRTTGEKAQVCCPVDSAKPHTSSQDVPKVQKSPPKQGDLSLHRNPTVTEVMGAAPTNSGEGFPGGVMAALRPSQQRSLGSIPSQETTPALQKVSGGEAP